LRHLPAILLLAYAILTALLIVRSELGLPFQLWLAMLLTLVGFSFTATAAWRRPGWRKAFLFLGLTLLVSLLFESLGVATGWIYGGYHYTDRLGPHFLGLVPYVIPLTWFTMLYPSYVIAERAVPTLWGGRRRWMAVAAVGAAAMLAWDLVLDPLMALRGHWVWEIPGAYFGIPLQNFAGWWLTAFIILALYLRLADSLQDEPLLGRDASDRLVVLGYALIGLGSAVEAWLAGLAEPASAGFLLMGVFVLLGW
jgi:putative membrane protein